MALPSIVKNWGLYADGLSYLGQISEVTLPVLERVMEKLRNGGMSGEIEIDLGMQAMTMSIVTQGFPAALLTAFGTGAYNGQMLRLAAAMQSEAGSGYDSVEVFVTGRCKKFDLGKLKAGEKSDQTLDFSLGYLRVSINNLPIIEIDPVRMIERVGGIDRLEELRAILLL